MFKRFFNKIKKTEIKKEDIIKKIEDGVEEINKRISKIIDIEKMKGISNIQLSGIIPDIKNMIKESESISDNIKEYLLFKLGEIERFKFADVEIRFKKIILLLKYVKQFEKDALDGRKTVLRDMKTIIDINSLSVEETERILQSLVKKSKE